MSYARKNSKNVMGAIVGIVVIAAVAVWQFYLFATFETASGVREAGNGTAHLWWAITMAVLACVASFLVFSVFMRHDHADDLHITTSPEINRV